MGKESLWGYLTKLFSSGDEEKPKPEPAPESDLRSRETLAAETPKPTRGADLYQDWAEEDHEWGRDREGQWREPEPRFLNFLEKYQDQIGPKILDIGCGNGRHLIPLADIGHDVTGVDSSSKMLETAARRATEQGVTYSLSQDDHSDLSLDSASQDTVVSIQTFQFSGSEGSFMEAARVLKPGGLFFLRVRSTSRYSDEYIESQPHIRKLNTNERGGQEVEVDFPGKKVHYHHYSEQELQDLADLASLEIIEEPVDERQVLPSGEVEPGQWNVVFRKKEQ